MKKKMDGSIIKNTIKNKYTTKNTKNTKNKRIFGSPERELKEVYYLKMEILYKNIKELGITTYIINQSNWKYKDFKESLKANTAFIFDTSTVGCGEFGEQNPNEIAQSKWKDAFGIMQCESNENNNVSLMFSVIPKFVVNNKETVKKFLKFKQLCDCCGEMKIHVQIQNDEGTVICYECIQDITNSIRFYEFKVS
jgi:hypothetical protein